MLKQYQTSNFFFVFFLLTEYREFFLLFAESGVPDELIEIYKNICNESPEFGVWDQDYRYLAALNFPGAQSFST